MNSIESENGASPINSLELLGLLSARLIHSLSNHLMVITGNVCAAERMRQDRAECDAALRAAVTAANATGALLNELARFRRDSQADLGHLGLGELRVFLQDWCERREGWSVRVDPSWTLSPAFLLPLSARMLCFVLDSIVAAAPAQVGEVQISQANGISTETVQLVIAHEASSAIDWELVRAQMKPFNLAASYEILAQLDAKPISRLTESARAVTTIRIRLTALPAVPVWPRAVAV